MYEGTKYRSARVPFRPRRRAISNKTYRVLMTIISGIVAGVIYIICNYLFG